MSALVMRSRINVTRDSIVTFFLQAILDWPVCHCSIPYNFFTAQIPCLGSRNEAEAVPASMQLSESK